MVALKKKYRLIFVVVLDDEELKLKAVIIERNHDLALEKAGEVGFFCNRNSPALFYFNKVLFCSELNLLFCHFL